MFHYIIPLFAVIFFLISVKMWINISSMKSGDSDYISVENDATMCSQPSGVNAYLNSLI